MKKSILLSVLVFGFVLSLGGFGLINEVSAQEVGDPCQDPNNNFGECAQFANCSGDPFTDTLNCGSSLVCCVESAADPTNPANPTGPGGSTGGVENPTNPTGPGSGSNPTTFANPLQFNTVQGLLGALLTGLQGIIVTLSLVFMVVGALLYIVSGGDEGRTKMAKGAMFAAGIGLALGIAAPSFLKEISNILGWGPDSAAICGTLPEPDQAVCLEQYEEQQGALTLGQIGINILNSLLGFIGILSIIMLVQAGIVYLMAAGNEDAIDKAKKMTKYSIIGLLVAIGALAIIRQIAAFFN